VAIEAQEILALTLIFIVHVAGGVMLVLGLLSGDTRPRPRWWRRGDGPGDPPPGPRPTPPSEDRPPLPLPGSRPSDVRLRDETPLRDAHPRPPRRPSRSPQPARSPQRR
jgi:hypothetical protein